MVVTKNSIKIELEKLKLKKVFPTINSRKLMSKNNLVQKKCIPCQGGIPPLSEVAAKKFLEQVDGWELVENVKKIQKKFEFKNFVESMEFINKVAEIAEQEQHHPNIKINYNKVSIELYTHAINGLSENDFILPAKINNIQ